MAHIAHKHYGSWQLISAKSMLKYIAIAVVALLGVAGLLQSIAGSSQISPYTNTNQGPTSVYGQ